MTKFRIWLMVTKWSQFAHMRFSNNSIKNKIRLNLLSLK